MRWCFWHSVSMIGNVQTVIYVKCSLVIYYFHVYGFIVAIQCMPLSAVRHFPVLHFQRPHRLTPKRLVPMIKSSSRYVTSAAALARSSNPLAFVQLVLFAILRSSVAVCRGVATGWTGVDMSTPFLPEVVPEIDANPVSSYSGGGGWESVMVWSLTRPSLPPPPGALPLDPLGAPSSDPRYRLVLRVLAICVHPTFFDLATPLAISPVNGEVGRCYGNQLIFVPKYTWLTDTTFTVCSDVSKRIGISQRRDDPSTLGKKLVHLRPVTLGFIIMLQRLIRRKY